MSQLTRQLLHTLRKESEECFRRGDYKEGDELQRIAIRKAMEYLVAQVKEDPGMLEKLKNSPSELKELMSNTVEEFDEDVTGFIDAIQQYIEDRGHNG